MKTTDGINSQRRQMIAAGMGIAAAAAGATATASKRNPVIPAPMRAYEIGAQTGLGALRLVQRTRPVPAAAQVLVKVHAAALNHRDLFIINARYGARKAENRVPLGDGAGEIVALGDGVSGFAIGERVTAAHFQSWVGGAFRPEVFANDAGSSVDGWLAEYVLLPASALVRTPQQLTDAEAAALGAAGITAWNTLVDFAQVQTGETVLTLGTGGVSAIVLQLARMHGARCAITSSSDDKLALAREHGAEIGINYRSHSAWDKAVLEATGGHGADVIAETVGQTTLGMSCNCLAANGRIGLIGNLGNVGNQGGRPTPGQAMPALGRGASTLRGIVSGSAQMLANVLQAYVVNRQKPYIDKTFSFGEAPAAYAYLESGSFFGKIVISG